MLLNHAPGQGTGKTADLLCDACEFVENGHLEDRNPSVSNPFSQGLPTEGFTYNSTHQPLNNLYT